MARVHMFKSSSGKQTKVTLEEELPASPSLAIDNTTSIEENALDVTASPKQTQALSLKNRYESAALTAALLQKASSNMMVAEAVAAALASKPDSLEMMSESTQKQLLSSLQQHTTEQKTESSNSSSSKTTATATRTTGETTIVKTKDTSECMDQAAAATALQLLGLAQQNNSGSPSKSKTTAPSPVPPPATITSPSKAESSTSQQQQLNSNVMMIANYPDLNTSNMTEQQQQQRQQAMDSTLLIEELGQKRGAWTREEDDLLLAGIKKFGYGRWKEIASIIPGRKGKQLKQRWDNTLAAKYVDQEWLKSKIRSDQLEDNRAGGSNIIATTNRLKSNASLTATSQRPSASTADMTDWNSIAQKISEKLKEGDQVAIENLISQALLGSLQSANNAVASTSSSSVNNGNSNNTLMNFSDPATTLLFLPHLLQQQQQQQQQQQKQKQPQQQTPPQQPQQSDTTAGGVQQHNNNPFFIPQQPSPNVKKRKRSDPALADTQSDAMSIYASATPITTTINNQTQTFYPCLFPDCGKTFARLYNLKSHSRTHTDDRPFVCNVCHIAFSRNHDLKRHGKIHGGDKPYQCAGCSKSFSRLDALKRHKSNQRNKATCTHAPLLQ